MTHCSPGRDPYRATAQDNSEIVCEENIVKLTVKHATPCQTDYDVVGMNTVL